MVPLQQRSNLAYLPVGCCSVRVGGNNIVHRSAFPGTVNDCPVVMPNTTFVIQAVASVGNARMLHQPIASDQNTSSLVVEPPSYLEAVSNHNLDLVLGAPIVGFAESIEDFKRGIEGTAVNPRTDDNSRKVSWLIRDNRSSISSYQVSQRWKQIWIGVFHSPGYANFYKFILLGIPDDVKGFPTSRPFLLNPSWNVSKRAFDSMVLAWRKVLHEWDEVSFSSIPNSFEITQQVEDAVKYYRDAWDVKENLNNFFKEATPADLEDLIE